MGTFNLKENTPILSKRDKNKFNLKNYNYVYKKKSIDDETYYIALSDIYDYKNEYYFGSELLVAPHLTKRSKYRSFEIGDLFICNSYSLAFCSCKYYNFS